MKVLLLYLMFISSVFAAGGYEKPSLWNAKGASLAGAISSYAQGTDAILFNPAGLNGKNEFQLGFGVFHGSLSSPIAQDEEEKTTPPMTLPSLGILFSKKIDSKLSVGFGVYAIAGNSIHHNKYNASNVESSFGSFQLDPYSDLGVLEYNTTLSYKLTNKMSFGVSLRAQSAQASFSQGSISTANGLGGFGVSDGTPLAASNVELTDLEGFEAGSYQLGWQFIEKNWGVGVVYRSSVEFNVKGKSSGNIAYSTTGANLVNVNSGGSIVPTAGQSYNLNGSNNASISTYLPEQFKIDGHYNHNKHTFFLGYALTKYSQNSKLEIKNADVTNSLTGDNIPVSDINTKWNDLTDYKLAYQYQLSNESILRLGYTYSTAVTNDNFAGATFATPSHYQHFAIGFGQHYNINNKLLELNVALERYQSSGRGSTEEINVDSNTKILSVEGDYSSNIDALMVGLTYHY